MKSLTVLSFAALGVALVIPDDEVMQQVAIEPHYHSSILDHTPSKKEIKSAIDEVEHILSEVFEETRDVFDHAVEVTDDSIRKTRHSCHQKAFDARSWIDQQVDDARSEFDSLKEEFGKQGHHHKPNRTVYELIAESKYTTKLAALINEYDDLVQLLNGTSANFTVFAPIDRAFEKIPDDAPKPSKEELKDVLLYHASAEFYPAGRVLVSHTIPSLFPGEDIGGKPQRLSTNIGLKGLTVNFYSRIIAIDIFGTNGVIHGVDSVLVPPPKAAEAIQFFPGEFSTLELGLTKTGLLPRINDTSTHVGGTIFAPNNFAFQKLGPKINAFLFSPYGLKYLKALLEYHVVADHTLYSDAYYKSESKEVAESGIPKGYFHVDLPTILKGKSLSIDVARYGRFISIKINAFSTVVVEDGIVSDGVIHIVSNVLIPPKKVDGVVTHWQGEELDVEDFKSRFPQADDAEFNEL